MNIVSDQWLHEGQSAPAQHGETLYHAGAFSFVIICHIDVLQAP